MIAPESPPARRPPHAALVLGATAIYALAALAEFASTPLGHVPLLDVRESLELARAIHDGTLAPEPFYRAPLYAAILSIAAGPGVPDAVLLDVARLVNLIAHLAATWSVYAIALVCWQSRPAATASALCFGLYPVAVHFAGDAQDTSLALALFLGGLRAAIAQLERPASRRAAATAGVLFALATLARPHYLSVFVAWALATLAAGALIPVRRQVAIVALAVAALPLLTMAFVNVRVGGEARVLPWQGPYNFWKANGPGANGRYFAHEVRVRYAGEHVNPTRREAEAIYRRETAATSVDRDRMNAYWTRRTLDHMFENPERWIALQASKLFYFVNDFEQYNTKTYHFHKARSRWLGPNPLSFAVLATLASLALVRHGRFRGSRLLVVGVGLTYLAGASLYFAGDRFRFPLAALAAILAGGVLVASKARARERIAAAALAAVVVVATWWPLPQPQRDETLEADHLLLAGAATGAGRWEDAHAHALAAVTRSDSAAANEAACVTGYNLLFASAAEGAPPWNEVSRVREHCARADGAPEARHADAVLAWYVGDESAAVAAWRSLSATEGTGASARAALVAAGIASPPGGELSDEEMLFARALRGDAAACDRLRRTSWTPASRRLVSLATIYRVDATACRDSDRTGTAQ